MKISLRQLQVFVLTNKLGSVSRAAEACFITQSAASMSLFELEKMLGFSLFDRVGKKLKLNTNGQMLLVRATGIIDQANEFEAFANHNMNTINGTLNVGASTTIGNYVLPYYLAQFQKKHPDVTLQLSIANTEQVIQELNQLNIDIGIIEGNCHSDAITKSIWKEDELVIVANHKHPLAKIPQVNYKELERYRWVCREAGSGTGELFLNYISGKFDPDIELTLLNPEAIKNYIRNSHCLTCVSKAIINEKTDKELKIINVKGFKLMRPFYLLSHKDKFKNAVTQAFEKRLL